MTAFKTEPIRFLERKELWEEMELECGGEGTAGGNRKEMLEGTGRRCWREPEGDATNASLVLGWRKSVSRVRKEVNNMYSLNSEGAEEGGTGHEQDMHHILTWGLQPGSGDGLPSLCIRTQQASSFCSSQIRING